MATTAMIGAALSVVRMALAPLTDSLLEKWAASKDLGSNVRALQLELLAVKAVLEHIVGKEIHNSALKELLEKLQDLSYDAEDVLDELDYFRIQDELDGTYHAADKHAKSATHNLVLNVRHTAKSVGKEIWLPAKRKAPCSKTNICNVSSASQTSNDQTVGKCFPSSSLPSVHDKDDDNHGVTSMHNNAPRRDHIKGESPNKLRFKRVHASERMQYIVDQLRRVRRIVSETIATIGPNWSIAPNIAQSRPNTTPGINRERKLYGRDLVMKSIIYDITKGKHSGEVLTVIPIVGAGGIGKTTLAQHIYDNVQVQQHFDVKVWICVSLNFDANRLTQQIERYVPRVHGEGIGTAGELIGQRLKNKSFLLVLDDMWDCSNEDEWEHLLVPFQKSQVQGNIIIATTRFPAQAQIMVKKIDHPIHLQGLDHKELKDLFHDFVFGDGQSRKKHTFLLETGDKIITKLKGSPLAAKTVGRLLKTQLDLDHWIRVLESKEWEQSNGDNDIMPALRLSYDHLHSPIQRCFSYCALFPQDYKFEKEELINFWIGLDVLHSSCGEKTRLEDIGLSHLTQLVNHGFFDRERRKDESTFYTIHDLLHELAQKVSSHECLSIDSSQSKVSSIKVLPSIRHLSINIDDTSVKDIFTLKTCVEDFNTLDKRLKVEKLRSLMLFGEHHGCFVKAFGDLFLEAKALRVIFLSKASYKVEDLLRNFYNLMHLRYLRIQSSSLVRTMCPNKLSTFYHMMVLDTKHCDIIELPIGMRNLVKLRHFLVQNDTTHSSIVDVGKLKSLQELRRFVVKQEGQGFELKQIGYLVELCGSLCIDNLENIEVKGEPDEAKLIHKSRLHELVLHWNNDQSTKDFSRQQDVVERLRPSSNLLKLCIKGHRGQACPSWLGVNLSVKSLESLCLDSVAWKAFPPIGELWLGNVPHEVISGNTPNERFENLRRLELVHLPLLKKWVVHAPCQLFPFLEVLAIRDCSELVELSFPHFACCQQGKKWFPRLSKLEIKYCPQLRSFPSVPWTEAPCSIEIQGTVNCSFLYGDSYSSEYGLTINGIDNGSDSTFWNVLDFHNLFKVEEFIMQNCPPLPLHRLQMLSSLRKLSLFCSSISFLFVETESHAKHQLPVETLSISWWSTSGKELTQLLSYFPKLSNLHLWSYYKVTWMGVMGQQAIATSRPSASANEVDKVQIEQHQHQHQHQRQDIISVERLLLLPPQLQSLDLCYCSELRMLFNPLDDNEEDERTEPCGGLQGLRSLQRLRIRDCPNLLSPLSPSFTSCFPFPSTLCYLCLFGAVGMETLEPLLNLSSLTTLSITQCWDLRGEGLFSLLAQGHLTKLSVIKAPNLFVASDPSCVHGQERPPCSSKLQELLIDDVAGFTAANIHTFLTELEIYEDKVVKRFTEEEEALLFVNSLHKIKFNCCSTLQYLPAGLYRLTNLKRLQISGCETIEILPMDGLPSSLQELDIISCPKIRSLPKDCLPSSLQKLLIINCPAIQTLPKMDELPSSLRELDVSNSGTEELRRQCRKLVGIIPIVKT